MTVFWAAAAVLGVCVIAVLALPVLRKPRASEDRAEYDVNVFKDQLSELEREAKEGQIGESELEAARLEIQRRLLAAASAEKKAKSATRKGDKIPVIAAAVVVPVLAAVIYVELGSPGTPGFPLAERTDTTRTQHAGAAAPHAGDGAPMSDAVRSLEARLQSNPGDVDGWILLARSYAGMGELSKAAGAYEKTLPLTDRHPMLLSDWAETALMARQGNFTQPIFEAFVEARMKDATLPKPWFYIGLDKAMGGELREAAQIWTDLITIQESNPEFVQAVRVQIEKAAAEGGFNASDIVPSDVAKNIAMQVGEVSDTHQPEVAQSSSAPPPGPTQEDMRAAQEMSEGDRAEMIRGMVQRLADRLEENPNDPAGWERLIRAYEVLGESDKAQEARERLQALQ